MLDADLAELYGGETRALVQAVKRNASRLPADFMFRLTRAEFDGLRSQTVMSNAGRGGRRTMPLAFTEQGVAMLSSVLGSPRAIAVNIEIVRTFVKLRQLAATHADLARRLAEVERKTASMASRHDAFGEETRGHLQQIFRALKSLMAPPDPPKRPIGFITSRETKAPPGKAARRSASPAKR